MTDKPALPAVEWADPDFDLHPADNPRTIRCTRCGTTAALDAKQRTLGGFTRWAREHDCARSAAARREAR